MKIKSIKLTGYIGIYNGMGLEEIFIDFDRGRHKNVVIKGRNGSGKSTLFSALHPLPDPNINLIPGKYAEKNIVISDNDIVYNILIKHPIKENKNKDRDTTKAYIEKMTVMGKEQLNPNGNVSSYKEILFSEFSLDPNFVALSQLSSDDRGLADKTPAERKKFVNSIIDCLAVYNDIHKSLTKRSSVFKSIMNNLVSKIDNIGDKEKLSLTLTSLENRLNNLMSDKDIIIEQLAASKSKIKLLDPDGSIQNTYDMIYNDLVRVNNELETISSKILSSLSKLNLDNTSTIEDIMLKYTDIKDHTLKLETSITIKESEINSLLSSREEEAKSLQSKTARLIALQSEKNYMNIDAEIENTRNKINEYKSILNMIGLDSLTITKDEFILGLNTIKEIKDSIDTFKSSMEYHMISEAISYIRKGIYPDIEGIDRRIKEIDDEISITQTKILEYEMLKEISLKLQFRPDNCTINNCSFIEDSLKAHNQNPVENLDRAETYLYQLNNDKTEYMKERKKYLDLVECINYLNSLCRNIERSSIVLNKLPISNIFANKDILLDNIMNGYPFKEIDELYSFIDYSNVLDEYKAEKSKLVELEADYKIYKSKASSLDEVMSDINNLNTKIDSITIKIDSYNKDIREDKLKVSNFKSMILELDVLISLYNDKKSLEASKLDLASKFNNIKNSITEIKSCISNIELLEGNLKSIDNQITPIINDRDKIKHGLVLLDEYEEELKIYNLKYEKTETIKKYSSPSKGIQTLFMSLYMNKTLTMANELLGLLFEGEYVLGKFEINETEFRIPCIGSGLTNNDISSMSTSQICMISMILSFVMLQQSSTKYNILKLDEIDGGLDTKNRLQFLHVLDQLMNMLNVEQCIMISHNTEMDLSNCDIIQLKLNEGESINSENVIFKY